MIRKSVEVKYEGHKNQILRGSAVALAVRIIGMGCSYLLTLYIAKLYSPQILGMYTLSMTVVQISITLVLLGFDSALVRFITRKKTKNNECCIYKTIFTISIVSALVFSVFLNSISGYLSENLFGDSKLGPYFEIASYALVPLVLLKINSSILRAEQRIFEHSFMDGVILPVLILLFIFFLKGEQGGKVTMLAYFLSVLISAGVSCLFVRAFVFGGKKNFGKRLKGKEILSISLPMMFTSSLALFIAWSDITMLAIYEEESVVGVYGVVMKIAMLSTLGLTALNTIFGPKISELSHLKNDIQLKKVIVESSRMLLLAGVVLLVFLLLVGRWVLGFFGEEYLTGITALNVLLVGFFFRNVAGSIGEVFNYSGRHVLQLKLLLIFAGLNVFMNFLFIPQYGLLGAALGTASAIIIGRIATLVVFFNLYGYVPILSTGR